MYVIVIYALQLCAGGGGDGGNDSVGNKTTLKKIATRAKRK